MTGSIDATPWARNAAATYAADKLRRLELCAERGIKPMRTDDGTVICLNDQTTLEGHPLRHDPAEVAALHAAAGPLLARLGRVP